MFINKSIFALFIGSWVSTFGFLNAASIDVPSGSATISQPITGAGGLTKTGPGTLILPVTNTYTGPTVISAGALSLTGSITSPVTVASGGTLSGTGTITGNVTNSGGTVKTGSTVGDFLTMTGAYTQGSLATLEINASNTIFDYLAITGTASLNGILNVNVPSGLTLPKTFKILQAAGGVTGLFSSLNPTGSGAAGVSLSIANWGYSGNQVLLAISDINNPLPSVLHDGGTQTITTNTTTSTTNQFGNNSTTNVNAGVTVTYTAALESDDGHTTTFGGDGKVTITGDCSGLHGDLTIKDNVTLTVNCPPGQGPQGSMNTEGSGKIMGTGPFSSMTIGPDGTFQGGNSIGTTVVTDNLNVLGTLVVQFSPDAQSSATTGASKYVVAGRADFTGGTLRLMPETIPVGTGGSAYPRTFNPGTYTYTIVSAGELHGASEPESGEFAGLEAPVIPGWSYTLDYANNFNDLLLKIKVDTSTVLADDTHAAVGGGASNLITYTNPLTTVPTYQQHHNPQPELFSLRRLNATSTANAIIEAAKAASSSAKSGADIAKSGQSEFSQLKTIPTHDRLQALLHAIAENGPISFETNNQQRIWISPFTHFGQVQTSADGPGNNSWELGALAGCEFRHQKQKAVIGALFGLLKGLQKTKGIVQDWLSFNGFNVGAYGSKEFLGHWRVEALWTWIKQNVAKQRSGKHPVNGSYLAQANYVQTTTVADGQISYKFLLTPNWSFRPNLGNTYINSTSGAYTERNVGEGAQSPTASKNISAEVYAGLGFRYKWENEDKDKVYHLTTVYEIGRDYYVRGSATNVTTTGGVLPTATFSVPGNNKKTTTHYFTVSGSVLDQLRGLKYLLSYNGTFTKLTRDHSFALKLEKRF